MTTLLGSLLIVTTLVSGTDSGGSPAAVRERAATQTAAPDDATVIRQRVKEGQRVRITDDQGRELKGRIGEFTANTVVLVTRDSQRTDVPYGTIVRIDRPHDGLGNGAGIGFMSGAILGLLAVISEEANDCEPGAFFSCGDPTAGAYAVVPLVFGGVGAGIGVGIDAMIRRDSTLFRRGDSRVVVGPALGRGVRGVRLSVRW